MKVGIIGTGWVADKHLHALSQIKGVEVAAIAGRNEGRTRELAAPFKANTYNHYLPLLERESLDAVFILLPPHLHGDLERACSEHVSSIFLEKPITTNLNQAHQIQGYFERAGTLVSVGYQNRYRASVQQALQYFTDEAPGILANGWWITEMPGAPWWRSREKSGGQFVEQCTHLVDLTRYFMGEIVEISAFHTGGFLDGVPGYTVDDAMVINARLASGALASFSTGCFPVGNHDDIGISLSLSTRHHRVVLESWDFEGTLHNGRDKPVPLPSTPDPFLLQHQAFADAVMQKNPEGILSDYLDAMRTLAVTLAANESAHQRQGAPVSVPSF
ncbi:MAG: Gfo/Idh/MocA family protein [Verrucomicrobiales bacterium]